MNKSWEYVAEGFSAQLCLHQVPEHLEGRKEPTMPLMEVRSTRMGPPRKMTILETSACVILNIVAAAVISVGLKCF